ncbi:hypothetical protein KC799_12355 [candidate division KSB1 bacterium]|nr:hypothetical protein [candidate division KSB1 bacterium]
MKQLDLIRLICSPVRFQACTRESALSAHEIAALLAQKDVHINPHQIEKLMNYVVWHDQNYRKENGKYFYDASEFALISR